MGDEIALVILQFVVPIPQILKIYKLFSTQKTRSAAVLYLLQVDLLSSPEARLSLLVHAPDVVILDWQDHKSVGVIFQQWFLTKIHSHFTLSDVFLSSLGLLDLLLLLIFFGVRERDGEVFNASKSHFGLGKLN